MKNSAIRAMVRNQLLIPSSTSIKVIFVAIVVNLYEFNVSWIIEDTEFSTIIRVEGIHINEKKFKF